MNVLLYIFVLKIFEKKSAPRILLKTYFKLFKEKRKKDIATVMQKKIRENTKYKKMISLVLI